MGRVINIHSAGKERTRLSKATVIAIRELMRQSDVNDQTKDLAAFIALSSKAISNTIEPSVSAWEKRGYWVKADRFRLEWSWSEILGAKMHQATLDEDWPTVASTVAQIAEKLRNVNVSERHRMGTPWVGAWKKLQDEN
ncbi:MAG: hypothetical protein KAS38_08825 [Anaerolineales bacterium]|nr:hypothetical protein [Anaerolineales bacterium]